MKTKFLPLLALAGIAILYAAFLNAKLKFGGDAVEYLQLATSLSQGDGYTINGAFFGKWPPVTPAIFAGMMGLFDCGVTGFKLINGLLTLGGLVCAWLLLRRRDDSQLPLYSVLLAAVSFPFIYWTVDVSTEGPYFLLTMVALWLGSRMLDDAGQNRLRRLLWSVGVGLAVGLAILTRTVGVTLLLGFGVFTAFQLARRRFEVLIPSAITAAVALVVFGLWFAYSADQGGESSVGAYAKYGFRSDTYDPNAETGLGNTLRQVKENFVGYLFIFSIPDSSLRMQQLNRLTPKGIISLGIMSLAIVGYLYHLFRRPRLPEYYVLCYGGVLLAFNWYDIRYVVPVLPLLFYYLATSIHGSARWLAGLVKKPNWAAYATGVAMGLLILANLAFSVASPQAKRLRSDQYRGPAEEIKQAALWIKEQDPNAVVMCRWANMTWWWTKLKTHGVGLIADPHEQWNVIRENGITHVIVDPDEFSGVTSKYLEPALLAHADQVEAVKRFGETSVYRVK